MFADAASMADRLVAEAGTRSALAMVCARTAAYPTPGGLFHGTVLLVAVLLRAAR